MKLYKLNNLKKIIYHLIPILSFLFDPFNMNVDQRIVFSSLLLVIIWWATDIVKKDIACAFLLGIFLIFGKSTPYQVFKFAFSPSFYLIMLSFLLSTGISNSKVADRIAALLLRRFGKTPMNLILLSFIFGVLLIFFIPQPFSRVILLSSIYNVFLNTKTDNEDVKEVLFLSIFISSTTTSMLFINGDIVLNYSALQLGGIHMVNQEWIRLMFLPSLITNVLVFFAFTYIFKSRLKPDYFKNQADGMISEVREDKASRKEISAVIIMIIVVLLWLTEALHGINAAIVAMIGVIAMFGLGILSFKDIKSINIGLLLFLTTAFAIGTVIKESGISALIFSVISSYMPNTSSVFFLLSIIIIVMGLHMFIGSSITTLSVAIPSFMQMTEGILDPLIIVLLCYVAVNIHYVLPFQHVTIMIGAANKFYSDRIVMKFGFVLTIITIASLLILYIPWWKIIGLL